MASNYPVTTYEYKAVPPPTTDLIGPPDIDLEARPSKFFHNTKFRYGYHPLRQFILAGILFLAMLTSVAILRAALAGTVVGGGEYQPSAVCKRGIDAMLDRDISPRRNAEPSKLILKRVEDSGPNTTKTTDTTGEHIKETESAKISVDVKSSESSQSAKGVQHLFITYGFHMH